MSVWLAQVNTGQHIVKNGGLTEAEACFARLSSTGWFACNRMAHCRMRMMHDSTESTRVPCRAHTCQSYRSPLRPVALKASQSSPGRYDFSCLCTSCTSTGTGFGFDRNRAGGGTTAVSSPCFTGDAGFTGGVVVAALIGDLATPATGDLDAACAAAVTGNDPTCCFRFVPAVAGTAAAGTCTVVTCLIGNSSLPCCADDAAAARPACSAAAPNCFVDGAGTLDVCNVASVKGPGTGR